MVYKPDYSLSFDGKEINFLFVSLTYEQYCLRKGIELEDMQRSVLKTLTAKEQQDEELQAAQDIKLTDYASILLAAHETYCIYHDVAFTAQKKDAFAWIDSVGGLIGGRETMFEIMKLFALKLLNLDPALFKAEGVEQDEKNVQPPAVNDSPGGSSNDLQPQRA